MRKIWLMLAVCIFGLMLTACQTTTKGTSSSNTTQASTTQTSAVLADAEFIGVNDVTISVGQEYSKLTGITAKDHDGTDLTNSITVDGILNANKAGVYEITYSVTGANGKTITTSRTITVLANARILGPENLPTSILVETPFNPLAGVTAKDYDDADLTSEIIVDGSIVKEDGTVDTSVPGEYVITYKVTGKSLAEVTVTITLTVFEKGDAQVVFSGVDEGKTNYITVVLGMPFNYKALAKGVDYDGADVAISEYQFPESMSPFITGDEFNPTTEGEYEFKYVVTGQNGTTRTYLLTVNVIKQGVLIDGVYIPIKAKDVNSVEKPFDAISIYTELKGKGEYGVLVIVDAHGRIILVRDCYNEQIDMSNPIKAGHPDQLRGAANNTGKGWSGADEFAGIVGPQGTPGGIPEGGFAIYFARSNQAGSTHPHRQLGLNYGREFGAKVELVGVNVNGFNPDLDNTDAVINGAEDIEINVGTPFDPLSGVSGVDKDGSPLTVSVVFNNVDPSKGVTGTTTHTDPTFKDGWYSVVYKVTGSNGYDVFVTRRVKVVIPMIDAEILGVTDQTIAVGESFSSLDGVTAKDYNGVDLTSSITTIGTVDINTVGTYDIIYKVTGANGVEVSITRKVTVAANARLLGLQNKTIYVGDGFDPMLGISAKDHDDTDLTSSVTVEGSLVKEDKTIDTSTTGTYELTYKVKGSSNVFVEQTITLTIIEKPNASISFENTTNDTVMTFVGNAFDFGTIAKAIDFDLSEIEFDSITYDEAIAGYIVGTVFTPNAEGTYFFTYKVTGSNGVEVTKILTLTVQSSGLIIDGTFVPVVASNINNDTKPSNSVLIYTELKGMGEFGVLAIVDAHGKIVMVRDCYGEQIDLNNPIKAGTPTSINGLPNGSAYDAFTGGLWSYWTAGSNDEFQGILGPQGTPNGIPVGGFAIYFSNTTAPSKTARTLGLNIAREFGLTVEVVGLSIPGYNPQLAQSNAAILGANDIELTVGSEFDPLAGVTGKDADGSDLTVSVAFNNVNTAEPVIPGAPRSVSDAAKRDAFAQGFYSVVYKVTGSNGYEVFVTRRVTVK